MASIFYARMPHQNLTAIPPRRAKVFRVGTTIFNGGGPWVKIRPGEVKWYREHKMHATDECTFEVYEQIVPAEVKKVQELVTTAVEPAEAVPSGPPPVPSANLEKTAPMASSPPGVEVKTGEGSPDPSMVEAEALLVGDGPIPPPGGRSSRPKFPSAASAAPPPQIPSEAPPPEGITPPVVEVPAAASAPPDVVPLPGGEGLGGGTG